jgi:hypothetical protein
MVAAAATLVAACGDAQMPPVATSCTDEPETITRALQAAPGEVTLPDGAQLSGCIRNARDDGELQNVGVTLSSAAEELEERAASDPRAALELGYLVGAARRGAATGSGVQDELVRRLERSAALDGASQAAVDALAEGLAAGEARG